MFRLQMKIHSLYKWDKIVPACVRAFITLKRYNRKLVESHKNTTEARFGKKTYPIREIYGFDKKAKHISPPKVGCNKTNDT